MTFKPAHLLLVLLALATAPVMAQSAAKAKGSEPSVAVVNGKAIPTARVDELVKQISSQPNGPKDEKDIAELRKKIIDQLVNFEILVQESDKLGLPKTTEVKEQLEFARQKILIQALMVNYLKKNPLTDADYQAEYNKQKLIAGDKEYKAHHILLGSEEEAKAVISKLKAGESFEELAKQSKDTGSANNGGALDWATPATYVKPFSDALVGLQKGQLTETPVQTQFGFHVIRLDDVRPIKFPTLEEAKPKLTELVEQQKLKAYEEELHKKAVVK